MASVTLGPVSVCVQRISDDGLELDAAMGELCGVAGDGRPADNSAEAAATGQRLCALHSARGTHTGTRPINGNAAASSWRCPSGALGRRGAQWRKRVAPANERQSSATDGPTMSWRMLRRPN